MNGLRLLACTGMAVLALALTDGAAKAQQCPVGKATERGFTIHFKNGEAFAVDRIADDVTYMRHVDNRGNTINSQELYRGLFTLATYGGRGRTVYTYDVEPAQFFPLHSEGVAEVGGEMIPEVGRPSPVYRSWRLSGAGTKFLDSGKEREFGCVYNVRSVDAVTTWPALGLEFRQQKLWSETLNMVLYLRTEVYEHGRQTRVTEFDADWIVE